MNATGVRRSSLLSLMVVGSVVSAFMATGVMAVFSDTARTGVNAAESGAIPTTGPGLELAPVVDGSCGLFSDDLTTGIFDVADVFAGSVFEAAVCLRNAGRESTTVSVGALDLVDTDVDCTGDESIHDSNGCGNSGPGELGPTLAVGITRTDSGSRRCGPGGGGAGTRLRNLFELSQAPGGAVSFAPGESSCLVLSLTPDGTRPSIAQSDRVTWRFAFFGTVPGPQPPVSTACNTDPENVPASAVFTGIICPLNGDKDQFTVTVPAGFTLTATLRFQPSEGDLALILPNPDYPDDLRPPPDGGQALGFSDDITDQEAISFTNPSGSARTYVLVVTSKVPATIAPTGAAFQLTVTLT